MVWAPGVGQVQANSTELGKLWPEDDLFCHMPVVSLVSTPSTNTLACPDSQHCSPIVPISAMAEPVKLIEAGSDAVVILLPCAMARVHLPVAGMPVGSMAAAANASA